MAACRQVRESREPGMLLLLDLDRFGAVAEALGPTAGDAILAAAESRIDATIAAGDRLLPLGADRFAILAAVGSDAAIELGDRLRTAVARPFAVAGRMVSSQASVGIAPLKTGLPITAVLRQAETALRRAKAEGRNRTALYEPRLEASGLEDALLQLDLAEALAHGQMHLVYQPYIDLAHGGIAGVEALLRWRHPARGELTPARFIPIAETTGLILPLGAWALRCALERGVRWPEHLTLSVNVSALQIHQPGFVAEVDAALAETGFPAARLELELTETVLMRDRPEAIAQIQALVDRGIRIALDDFGTGYSALAYLARLPHHRIKLDRSFVHDLGNPATAELIRAIVASARARGIAVTAEGVELPSQLEDVRRIGFTHAQGFATGAPLEEPLAPAPDRIREPTG